MDFGEFLRSTRGRIAIAAGLGLILVIIFLLVSLTPRSNAQKEQFHFSPLTIGEPSTAFIRDDRLYLENGRQIVRYQNGSLSSVGASPGILPDIDQLFVSHDERRALVRSAGYLPNDITQPTREQLNLDSIASYWWAYDVASGGMQLITNGETPVRMTTTQYDTATDTLWGLDADASRAGPQKLYKINAGGEVQRTWELPLYFREFVISGDTVTGLTGNDEIVRIVVNEQGVVPGRAILTDVNFASIAPDGKWAAVAQNSNDAPGLLSLINLDKIQETVPIGVIDEPFAVWQDNQRILVPDLSKVERSSGLQQYTLGKAQPMVLSQKDGELISGERIVATSPDLSVVADQNDRFWLISRTKFTAGGTPKALQTGNDDVEVLYSGSTGYAVANQRNLGLTQQQVITAAEALLKKEGFEPLVTEINFNFVTQIPRVEDFSE